jgi:type I restriction enzyme R subunit
MSEPALSERDVCTKLITPSLERSGWDIQSQVREEVALTAGQVMVRGRLVARGKAKRADYVLAEAVVQEMVA